MRGLPRPGLRLLVEDREPVRDSPRLLPGLTVPGVLPQPQVPQTGQTLPRELQLPRILAAETGYKRGLEDLGEVTGGVEVWLARVVDYEGWPGILQLLLVLLLVLGCLHRGGPDPDPVVDAFRLNGRHVTEVLQLTFQLGPDIRKFFFKDC